MPIGRPAILDDKPATGTVRPLDPAAGEKVPGSASEDRPEVPATGGDVSRPASAGRTEGAVRPDVLIQPARMGAVPITRFGGPEVMDVVDLPDPVPADGQQLYEVSSAGVDSADTHHLLSRNPHQRS